MTVNYVTLYCGNIGDKSLSGKNICKKFCIGRGINVDISVTNIGT